MRAGTLRHRITVQQASETVNSFNETVSGYAGGGVVWGEMRPLMSRARELFAEVAGQVANRTPYQCRLRQGAATVTATKTRLVWEGRRFEVEAVMDPDGRGRELVALCYEVQA